MRGANKLSEERARKLREMYLAGEKYLVIQAELGVSDSTIRRYCVEPFKGQRPSSLRPRTQKGTFARWDK